MYYNYHITCISILRSLRKCMNRFPEVPLTYFNDGGGGGGLSDFFGSEILAKSVWVYERHRDFSGLRKKHRGSFLGCEKRTKGFFGYAKKSSDIFG